MDASVVVGSVVGLYSYISASQMIVLHMMTQKQHMCRYTLHNAASVTQKPDQVADEWFNQQFLLSFYKGGCHIVFRG